MLFCSLSWSYSRLALSLSTCTVKKFREINLSWNNYKQCIDKISDLAALTVSALNIFATSGYCRVEDKLHLSMREYFNFVWMQYFPAIVPTNSKIQAYTK